MTHPRSKVQPSPLEVRLSRQVSGEFRVSVARDVVDREDTVLGRGVKSDCSVTGRARLNTGGSSRKLEGRSVSFLVGEVLPNGSSPLNKVRPVAGSRSVIVVVTVLEAG